MTRTWTRLIPIALLVVGLFLLSTPQVLNPTPYIASTTPQVQAAILEVQSRSTTDYDRIVNTAEYINQIVAYDTNVPDCVGQTPEDVLTVRAGNCVSTSKLAAAMLTGMQIPVLIVEGCALPLQRSWLIPRDPIVKRTAAPQKMAGGQLHNWIRAYDGHTWYTVETTAGVVFPSTNEASYGYNTFGGYVDPADPEHLCFLPDERYVQFCTEATP